MEEGTCQLNQPNELFARFFVQLLTSNRSNARANSQVPAVFRPKGAVICSNVGSIRTNQIIGTAFNAWEAGYAQKRCGRLLSGWGRSEVGWPNAQIGWLIHRVDAAALSAGIAAVCDVDVSRG